MIGGLAAGLIGVALLVPLEAFDRRLAAAVGIRRDPPRRDVVGARRALFGDRAAAARSVRARGDDAAVWRGAPAHGERRDRRARPCRPAPRSPERSLLGLAYLIVFGSVVAFSAYTWLLERCSATLVATHTYVNPVIAVLLGWLFAGEPLTTRIALATGLILSAVLLLKSESTRQGAEAGAAVCSQPARPSRANDGAGRTIRQV